MPALFLIVILCLTSCAKLQYLEQGLTLQSYSRERDAQAELIEEQDRRFENLYQMALRGEPFTQFPDTTHFMAAFGQPILIERIKQGGQDRQRWLYRYATRYFNTQKVYVFFDERGQLVQVACAALR